MAWLKEQCELSSVDLKATKGDSLQERISKFPFTYRITPHTTMGIAPAQLLINHRLRSRFDCLFLNLQQHVQRKQAEHAASHNNSKPLRSFKVGDLVYTKVFSSTSLIWIPGTVAKVTGPLSYHIEPGDGCVVRRHVDAVRVQWDSADSSLLNDFPLPQDDLYLPTQVSHPHLLRYRQYLQYIVQLDHVHAPTIYIDF